MTLVSLGKMLSYTCVFASLLPTGINGYLRDVEILWSNKPVEPHGKKDYWNSFVPNDSVMRNGTLL